MRNIVIVAGNGDMAFGEEEVQKLKKGLSDIEETGEVTVIGDGKKDISLDDIQKGIKDLDGSAPTTIFFQNHGKVKDGKFYFMSGKGDFSSKEAYSELAKKFQELDIFNTACESGASLKDIDVLPEGTKVVTLSKEDDGTIGGQIERMIDNLSNYKGEVDSERLLRFYLVHGTRNRSSVPQIGISGHDEIIDLDALLERKIGQEFNQERVLEATRGLMDDKEAREYCERFQKANNEYEFMAVEYGKAMAIALSEQFGIEVNGENIQDLRKTTKDWSDYTSGWERRLFKF